MTTRILPATQEEIDELRKAGGMKISFYQTYDDIKNDTFTCVIDALPEFPNMTKSDADSR